MGFDFIAIDFETATAEMNSACSLGIACVSDFKIIDKKNFLIQPPNNKYSAKNIAIHGITPDTTSASPTFGGLWPEIQDLFRDCIVVAHNVRFDLSVLKSCLDTYSLSCNDFRYIDSITVSNRVVKGQGIGTSLVDRANYFNIPVGKHHNALDDAVTCANIVISSVKTTNRKSLKTYCSSYRSRATHNFSELKPMDSPFARTPWDELYVPISGIVPAQTPTNTGHPFYSKSFVVTGDFDTMTRAAIMQKIVDVGGIVKSSVSSKTDFLVVGKQKTELVGASGKSTKERKAHELISNGSKIEILNEQEFLKILLVDPLAKP